MVIHFVLHGVSVIERSAVVEALAHKLKPGGRLVLREPQGEGLMPDELRRLADTAGLEVRTLDARKLAIGGVYNASFAHNNYQ